MTSVLPEGPTILFSGIISILIDFRDQMSLSARNDVEDIHYCSKCNPEGTSWSVINEK